MDRADIVSKLKERIRIMKEIYWLFAVVYAFIAWGFGWGIFNIFIPIAPLVDLVKYIIHLR